VASPIVTPVGSSEVIDPVPLTDTGDEFDPPALPGVPGAMLPEVHDTDPFADCPGAFGITEAARRNTTE
jgi:hypothetical protein